jgi:uncharacterized SAM-binding protein YcdF (DUF218 family)
MYFQSKLYGMFSELKPYITAIVFSPTLLLIGIALGLCFSSKKPKLGRSLAIFSTALLWIFSTPVFSVWLSHNLLTQYNPTSEQELKSQGVQAIVVLGGGVETGQPNGIQQLQATAIDRLRHGIELSRKTGIPVMVTGGKGWGAKAGSENEAEISSRVAREVFQFEIKWTESESRDTQENASNSKQLLTMQGIGKIALVTHSWHMPRSLKAFQKVGFEVTPAPMGFVGDKKVELISLLPNGGALNSTTATFKEIVAQVVQGQ